MAYPAKPYAGSNQENVKGYRYNFFVSYTRDDLSCARSLASELVDRGYFVFFAPESLIHHNDSRPDQNYWASILQSALLESCHFIGICTDLYLKRDWAGGLELCAFRNIRAANIDRKLALLTDDASVQLDNSLAAYRQTSDNILVWAEAAASAQPMKLGENYAPDLCLSPLPLRERSTYPWREEEDGARYPFAPYDVYEDCVREILMILKYNVADKDVVARYMSRPGLGWSQWDVECALGDAKSLAAIGISPFA